MTGVLTAQPSVAPQSLGGRYKSTFKVTDVLRTKTPPTIDGNTTDAVWQLATAQPLTFTVPTPSDTNAVTTLPSKLSATFKATFDTNYFYILVQVTSSKSPKIMDSTVKAQRDVPWTFDDVEVFFNCDTNTNAWDGQDPQKNYYKPEGTSGSAEQIRFMRFSPWNPASYNIPINLSIKPSSPACGGDCTNGYDVGYGWGFDSNEFSDTINFGLFKYAKYYSREVVGGWNMEAKIPMRSIMAPLDTLKWEDMKNKDTLIGFDVSVSAKGDNSSDNVVWANNTSRDDEWRDTRCFGFIRLKAGQYLGINENVLNNPSMHCFINNNVININADNTISKVNLYNLTGQLIKSTDNIKNKNFKLNVSDINSSMYIVEIYDTKNNHGTYKIFKQ